MQYHFEGMGKWHVRVVSCQSQAWFRLTFNREPSGMVQGQHLWLGESACKKERILHLVPEVNFKFGIQIPYIVSIHNPPRTKMTIYAGEYIPVSPNKNPSLSLSTCDTRPHSSSNRNR